jgi:hypothetical protein
LIDLIFLLEIFIDSVLSVRARSRFRGAECFFVVGIIEFDDLTTCINVGSLVVADLEDLGGGGGGQTLSRAAAMADQTKLSRCYSQQTNSSSQDAKIRKKAVNTKINEVIKRLM